MLKNKKTKLTKTESAKLTTFTKRLKSGKGLTEDELNIYEDLYKKSSTKRTRSISSKVGALKRQFKEQKLTPAEKEELHEKRSQIGRYGAIVKKIISAKKLSSKEEDFFTDYITEKKGKRGTDYSGYSDYTDYSDYSGYSDYTDYSDYSDDTDYTGDVSYQDDDYYPTSEEVYKENIDNLISQYESQSGGESLDFLRELISHFSYEYGSREIYDNFANNYEEASSIIDAILRYSDTDDSYMKNQAIHKFVSLVTDKPISLKSAQKINDLINFDATENKEEQIVQAFDAETGKFISVNTETGEVLT